MTQQLQVQPASLTGAAQRISAADKAALAAKATPAVLRATIQITRAATGKVEEYQIVGTAEPTAPQTDGADA